MNQQQRKYARERIESLYEDKVDAIREKCETPAIKITAQARCRLVKQGKVKLKKGVTKINTYDGVVNVFDFSEYEKKSGFDAARYTKAVESLKKEKSKIMDELMLGDAEQAIKLINKFASKSINNF